MAQLQSTSITGTLSATGAVTLSNYGAGFVRLNSSGAIVMDTNTYVTGGPYLPLSGGTVTGTTVYTGLLQARRNQTAGDYTTAALWTESFGNTATGIAFHISGNVGKFLEMRTNGILYWDQATVWTSSTLTNLNQLTNGPGYITQTNALQPIYGNSGSFNIDTNAGQHATVRFSQGTWGGTNPNPGNWSHIFSVNGSTDNRTVQLYMGDVPGAIWWRMNQGGTQHQWERILTSNNFSSVIGSFLPLSGGTLTGPLTIGTTVGSIIWNDGNGTYVENTGNSTATRKIRLQAHNGSFSYAQLFIDGGNNQVYTTVGGVTNFLVDGSVTYLRHNGSDRFWTGSDGTRTQGWAYFQNTSQGLHWPGNNWHLHPASASDFIIRSGSNTDSALRFDTNGTTRGYVYAENDNSIGFLSNGRGWSLRAYSDGNIVTYGHYLTVGQGRAWSSISMHDSDEGTREIHCNSNRIGFLTQAGSWGAWLYDGADWEAASSVRAPIFYDSNDTGYYLDLNSTSDSALRIRGGALFGPNTTWGASLYVGGNGRVGTSATVAVTNGNLHMDCQDGYEIFLNWYSGRPVWTGGNLGVGAASASFRLHVHGTGFATNDFRAPIFYDSQDTAYYLDPGATSNLSMWTADTSARLGRSRYWTNRWAIYGSANDYMTGTNGWGTGEGTWANAWKGGFSGWDIWGSNTDHPQGSGYVHAQGIVSGQHAAASDGSTGYGWMMVGAADATANRYWLRGKWGTTTSGWVEMITTGNISSQSVSYASSSGNADTVDGYHATFSGNANTIPVRNGNGYLEPNNWIQFNGSYGIYDPTNSAHLFRNNHSYGSWKVLGERNGWRGLHFGESTGITLMMNEGEFGFHRENVGWVARFTSGTGYFNISGTAGSETLNTVSSRGNTIDTRSVVFTNASSYGIRWDFSSWTNNAYVRLDNTFDLTLGGHSTIRFVTNHLNVGDVVRMSIDSAGTVSVAGTLTAAGDLRAPIFYDSANTSFYFDGNATADSIRVAGDVVAYFSDERLKTRKGNITDALSKVMSLNGFYYTPNDVAASYGYEKKLQVGLSAQEVEAILPEIIKDAPIGDGYKTVDYSKLTPLLVEAIKEQQAQIKSLQVTIEQLLNK